MPLRHQPVSLRSAALISIANNFELICYGKHSTEEMVKLLNTDEYLDVEGPFGEMPSSILQDLMKTISNAKSLHKKHLHILMQSQIDDLDLSYGTGSDCTHGFLFMRDRCKPKIGILHRLIRALTHVRSLAWAQTKPTVISLEHDVGTVLAASILQDLSEELKHVTHLRRHHLHLILRPQIREWVSHGTADLHIAISLMSARCQNLRRLNISYLRHMGPNALISLLPCFASLVSLNLQMTLTVDQILCEIGKRCVNLVDLNLAMTPITDRGLVQLCVGCDGRRLCQKVQRLMISETYATVAGATIVLQSLPNLREFDFEKIFEALEQISIWNHDLEMRLLCGAGVRLNAETMPPPETLRLATLISTADMVSMDGIDAAARLCVDARSVVLSNAWLPSEALYKFMLLEKLTSLSLTNCDGLTLDFHEGVLPLLAVCGSKLENLILTNFTTVDITSIGKACIGLKNLALSNIATYEFTGQPITEIFNHLRALELWSDPQAYLNPNMIRQMLLYSSNMTNLLFKGCEVLTDKFVADILSVNPMPRLSHLTLDHCHGVSGSTLHLLLDADNELAVVRLWNCMNITKSANNEIRHRIRNENMDIYLEWFQYDE